MRTLLIQAKCSDCCVIELIDTEANITKENHGYVPRNLGIGGGDYVKLEVDIDSGKIIGWEYPENEDILQELKNM